MKRFDWLRLFIVGAAIYAAAIAPVPAQPSGESIQPFVDSLLTEGKPPSPMWWTVSGDGNYDPKSGYVPNTPFRSDYLAAIPTLKGCGFKALAVTCRPGCYKDAATVHAYFDSLHASGIQIVPGMYLRDCLVSVTKDDPPGAKWCNTPGQWCDWEPYRVYLDCVATYKAAYPATRFWICDSEFVFMGAEENKAWNAITIAATASHLSRLQAGFIALGVAPVYFGLQPTITRPSLTRLTQPIRDEWTMARQSPWVLSPAGPTWTTDTTGIVNPLSLFNAPTNSPPAQATTAVQFMAASSPKVYFAALSGGNGQINVSAFKAATQPSRLP